MMRRTNLRVSLIALVTALVNAGCASLMGAGVNQNPSQLASEEPVSAATDPAVETPASEDAPAAAAEQALEVDPAQSAPEAAATRTAAQTSDSVTAVDETSKSNAYRSADGIDDETPLPTDVNSAAAKAFEAAVQLSRSEPARAAQAFADAASQTTYFYAAWFNAGASAERAGDRKAAESYYRKALEVRPDYGPALANLALLLETSGRASEGQQLISRALGEHGDRAGPHLAAAAAAYRTRQWDKAEREALNAVRIDERMVPAQHIMARIFMQKERYETARFALENALDLEPGNALLRLDLGHVLLKLDQERNALLEYGKAAQLRPDLAEAQQNYGVMLLQNGDPEAALVALQKAVELEPNEPKAHLNFGNALRANRKYKEAVAEYEKAIELDESTHAAYFNLALLYMDNEIEGLEELDQLKQASGQFDTFAEVVGEPDAQTRSRLTEYRESIDKRVKRIERRLERERQRKMIEEADKAKVAEGAESGSADATTDSAEGDRDSPGESAEGDEK